MAHRDRARRPVSVRLYRLRFGHAMTARSHERLPYFTVRVTFGHGQLLAESTNVPSQRTPDWYGMTVCALGIPCHLKSGGNRSGIPSLISYRWLQCLQKSESWTMGKAGSARTGGPLRSSF